MSQSRAVLALLPFLLAAPLLLPATAAAASAFVQAWTLPGWELVQVVGNTDGDDQLELLFASKADGHVALVDGLTGAIAKEFPDFARDNTALTAHDVDQDGRLELFFWRPGNGPVTPLVTGYDWDGASYATLFSHAEGTDQWSLVSLRNATTFEALEVSPTDLRVRDLAGTVLFRASTAVPGWSGNAPSVFAQDIDQDGILELGAMENIFTPTAKVHFFDYSGGFVPTWSKSGWQVLGSVFTDTDPQPELVMAHGTDGHYGLFDGVSGAQEADFPEFTFFQPASIAAWDMDGDAPAELFLWRQENFPTTRLFRAYDFSGGTYTQTFSHTDLLDNFSIGNFRSATQYDFLETTSFPNPGEIRVRNAAGSVLFRASTDIPGWSGVGLIPVEIDTDGDGIRELAIQDGNTLRFVRHTGAAFVQPWSTTAWSLQSELSNVDGDPQTELLVASTSDQRYALLDPPTGAVEHQFPAFTTDDSYLLPHDIDNDGRLELFFGRHSFAPQLYTAYNWTPQGYATLHSHTDEVQGTGFVRLRAPGTTELAEFGVNDLRVRSATGTVLFRASTDLAGWTGVDRDMAVVDVDNDGVSELIASDAGSVRLVRYVGLLSAIGPDGGDGFRLLANAPNPFHDGTAFRFATRAPGNVGIRVFDASGRLVRELGDLLPAGRHEIAWDGRDERGHSVPSGLFFYEVNAGGTRQVGKMVRVGQ